MKAKTWPTTIENLTKLQLFEVPLSEFIGDKHERWFRARKALKGFLDVYKNPLIVDLAMGSGPDTIALLRGGYKVVSNEVDDYGISLAQAAAEKEGVALTLRMVDWKKIGSSAEYRSEEFDFAFSLGNSFPSYLMEESDRRIALQGFWKILKPGGTLIFDSRNYDYIFSHAEEILEDPERRFPYTYKTNYLGKSIVGFPVEIEEERIHFVWKHTTRSQYVEEFFWPATEKRVEDLVHNAIGKDVNVQKLYDYQEKKPEQYDFVQYILHK